MMSWLVLAFECGSSSSRVCICCIQVKHGKPTTTRPAGSIRMLSAREGSSEGALDTGSRHMATAQEGPGNATSASEGQVGLNSGGSSSRSPSGRQHAQGTRPGSGADPIPQVLRGRTEGGTSGAVGTGFRLAALRHEQLVMAGSSGQLADMAKQLRGATAGGAGHRRVVSHGDASTRAALRTPQELAALRQEKAQVQALLSELVSMPVASISSSRPRSPPTLPQHQQQQQHEPQQDGTQIRLAPGMLRRPPPRDASHAGTSQAPLHSAQAAQNMAVVGHVHMHSNQLYQSHHQHQQPVSSMPHPCHTVKPAPSAPRLHLPDATSLLPMLSDVLASPVAQPAAAVNGINSTCRQHQAQAPQPAAGVHSSTQSAANGRRQRQPGPVAEGTEPGSSSGGVSVSPGDRTRLVAPGDYSSRAGIPERQPRSSSSVFQALTPPQVPRRSQAGLHGDALQLGSSFSLSNSDAAQHSSHQQTAGAGLQGSGGELRLTAKEWWEVVREAVYAGRVRALLLDKVWEGWEVACAPHAGLPSKDGAT
jgi:hypothetical protein